MEKEPFDIEDIRDEEESVKDLPIEDHVVEQPAADRRSSGRTEGVCPASGVVAERSSV